MIRSAVAALAAAAMLTACVGGSDAKPAATKPAVTFTPEAGDCLVRESSKLNLASPDLTKAVRCTTRHEFEVTGTTTVPRRFLDRSADPVDMRDRLLQPTDIRESAFHRYANLTCSIEAWRALHVDAHSIENRGVRLSEIAAFPMTTGMTYHHTLSNERAWRAGDRKLICFAEFRDPDVANWRDAQEPVTSYNLKPLFEKFFGEHFPPERRRCYNAGDTDRPGPIPCTRPHDAESIFSFDSRLAFGDEVVKEAARSSLSKDFAHRTAAICGELMSQLFDTAIDKEVTSWIWFGNTTLAAWSTDSDSGDETNYYPAECQLWSSDRSLVLAPGTVVDSPERAELEDHSYHADA